MADNVLLKIPDEVKDEQAIFLSDAACSGLHATELANVKEGDVVGIFGSGPIGLTSVIFAKLKGAKKIIVIDQHDHLLQLAETLGKIKN
jgi:threonine dehydrogenase-like Zn-dependent dehydrogenase